MAALPPTPRPRVLAAAPCHVPSRRRRRVCDGLCSAVAADNGCAESPDVVLECKRLNRLVKSGRLADALDLFDRMPRKNVVAWTSVMSGCTRNGRPEAALAMFADMVESGVAPNDFACNAALVACADLGALRAGEQVHSLAVRAGFAGDAWIGSCLIEMYSRCGSLPAAKEVFDRMDSPDVVGYTSLISAFCRNGEFELAAEALIQMMKQGLKPNEHTMTTILTACPRVLGQQIHGYLIKKIGLRSQSVYSSTALIDFYSRNGEFKLAKAVFDSLHCKNVVSWCSMMQLYIRDGRLEEALQVFGDMISEGVDPNEFALSIVLGACGSIGLGRQLHCSAIKHDLITDIRVSNALLSMYGRTGLVEELEAMLNKIENPDLVSWTTAISANFQNGFGEKAIALLCQMHSEGFTPNDYAFSSVLSSCADVASLDQGMQFHCLALKLGCDSEICTRNALINMYSKCGQMGSARLAFDVMHTHDVTSWNSLIHGYAQHGDANKALEVFSKMRSNGVKPDDSTFLGVLMGCNHSGMVEEGELFFRLMIDQYSFTPAPSHYACMIDMLGRNGRFDEALRMINDMPFEPDALIWKTLLASCKLHRNLDIGKLAADRLMELSDRDSASYVLMSNIYAMHGEWEDARKVRRRMDETGVKKDAGCSWIEINNEVHTFASRDMSHPNSDSIYQMLGELVAVMQDFDELEPRHHSSSSSINSGGGRRTHVAAVPPSLLPQHQQIENHGDLTSGSNQDVWAILSVEVASNLSKSVVSLTLSDGNTLIYACSGIVIECQEGSGTIFLTSASLVTAFYDTEEVYDNLKIEVRHEGNEVLKGYLAKYDLDKNFAVVYTMESLDVHIVLAENSRDRYINKKLVAVGRDKHGVLMAKSVMVAGCRDSNRSEDSKEIRLISEDWEGGPLFDFDGKFVGMNRFSVMDRTSVLSWVSILIILKHYLPSLQNRILKRLQNVKRVRDGERPTGELPDYHPEAPVHRGGLNTEQFGYLNSMGYPKPPINVLDETFGDLCGEDLWSEINKKGCTTILTSASLVRESDDGNKIDENLRIEVLLPNKQLREGTLQHYSLHYNVALVSVKDKDFHARPANIQLDHNHGPGVAAVGRCFESGKLMAARTDVVDWSGTLDCEMFLIRSSCKITKAGIGGPLVDLEGKVIGMNFYDKKIGTPCLPWNVILMVLACFEKESSGGEVGSGSDPCGAPGWKIPRDESVRLNRWPVPLPYWRPHDDVDEQEPPEGCEHIYTYINGERYCYR
uniref:Uncharacterized protein n=1 Tax=Oryza glaberrima TaxID=4538 RepID=I1PHA1_ORYGL